MDGALKGVAEGSTEISDPKRASSCSGDMLRSSEAKFASHNVPNRTRNETPPVTIERKPKLSGLNFGSSLGISDKGLPGFCLTQLFCQLSSLTSGSATVLPSSLPSSDDRTKTVRRDAFTERRDTPADLMGFEVCLQSGSLPTFLNKAVGLLN